MEKTLKKSQQKAIDSGCSNTKPKGPEKRRNNEKRKEKSRDAARCRRSRETEIFTDLANVLPVRREDIEQLDKASIMRLSIAYLKVRNMFELFPQLQNDLPILEAAKDGIDEDTNVENFVMQALDGFMFVLSGDGDVTYVSENVSEYLGIQQIDMLGQQIWDYAHQCDHDELREMLNGRRGKINIAKKGKETETQQYMHRDFLLRLKCTLTSRGRSVNIKSASYKVMHVSGHIAVHENGERLFFAIGRPVPHPSNIEVPLGSSTFLTKHTLDMKFSYVDEKMQSLLGYQPEDLMNKSLYEYHHGADSESLMGSFKCAISKGQTETCRYRFLAKYGGYCWVVTQATLVFDKQKPQSVVCVNYIVSGVENENEIYSCAQLEAQKSSNKEENIKSDENCKESDIIDIIKELPSIAIGYQSTTSVVRKLVTDDSVSSNIVKPKDNRPRSVTASVFSPVSDISIPSVRPQSVTSSLFTSGITPKITANRAQSNTAKLFTPRTGDMNKSLLKFLEEGTVEHTTMLKEEPDDLSHLAPTAGDACIPLEESTPLFGEMFDGLILPDGYGSLLQDDINSLDSQTNKNTIIDPFLNYREESCDTVSTPNLLSPASDGRLSKSPNGNSSLPSLCSPNSLCNDDEFAFMTMNCEDDIDLTMRAPYIPMNESDDLPLLTEDLMWSAFSDELHKDVCIRDVANINNDAMLKESTLMSNGSINNQHQQHQQQENQIDFKINKSIDKVKRSNIDFINCNNERNTTTIYPKNQSSLDTQWTMTDLLQLNNSNNISNQKAMTTICPIQIHHNPQNTISVKKIDRTINKRPFNTTLTNESNNSTNKRIKGLLCNDVRSSPQLLQQLMAPTPQQRSRTTKDGCINNGNLYQQKSADTSKWIMDNAAASTIMANNQSAMEQHASNSVLKNLLVSGCDENISIKPPDILMADNSLPINKMSGTIVQCVNTPSMNHLTCSTKSCNILDPMLSNNITKNMIHSNKRHIDHNNIEYMDTNDLKKRKLTDSSINIDDKFMTVESDLTFPTIDDDILPIPIESLLLELGEQNFNMDDDDTINDTFLRDRISSTDIEEWANQMT